MKCNMGPMNFEEQFTYYALYHRSIVNRIIHIFSIGPLLWSVFVLTEYIPLEVPEHFNYIVWVIHRLNVSFLIAVSYSTVYIWIDKKTGLIGAILIFTSLITAQKFYLSTAENYGVSAWQIALVTYIVFSIAQIIGHKLFEKRMQDFNENLMQTCVTAPLFVVVDVLFSMGYNPELQKAVWRNIEIETVKHKNKSNRDVEAEAKKD